MDRKEAINRLCYIRCALLGGTKPQIEPNETNIELLDKAIEALQAVEQNQQLGNCSCEAEMQEGDFTYTKEVPFIRWYCFVI